MPYAARTRVPISRTKTDIEELLAKHGATGFAYALSWQASVQSLPLQDRRHGGYLRPPQLRLRVSMSTCPLDWRILS